ncbi:hypothetical protein CFR78_14315 [Komagataeibacter rhaeticus]|uniref:hypothetical protein n=1 Tax=Komagataeibacter rhaeticus TaxID=215221 RepID=UPI00054D8382|nr:hypothetical protein [Komagataeibacter rhaeticus]PYD52523.1 hypothetical protein CFR78_14315 [Komagataeibacter rhaeticus]GBQ13336.1 hypothetical protein AA16663_1446 [Komagataeibacter rhaeticus DSM 16663]
MRLIQASEVQKLTGLTSDQLREWTSRRGLIQADLKPSGPGTRARFAWQSVLLLRIAVVLKERFHIELQSQKPLFLALSVRLAKISFPALRETALVLEPGGGFDILPLGALRRLAEKGDCLILTLDPHLDLLSMQFGMPAPMRQLPLFPVRAIR